MKTIFWDEHTSKQVTEAPVLDKPSKTITWFYIIEDGYFMLYHNVEI